MGERENGAILLLDKTNGMPACAGMTVVLFVELVLLKPEFGRNVNETNGMPAFHLRKMLRWTYF